MQHPFWNKHYNTFQVQEPSDFSHHCAKRYLQKSDVLIEMGCGNGRDGIMLSSHVSRYVGIDSCPTAIEYFSRSIKQVSLNGQSRSDLLQADFTSIDFNRFVEFPSRLALYSRFSLHSITYPEQHQLFENIKRISAPWVFMLEARTIYDTLYGIGRGIGPHEYETDHYRRFIDPDSFLSEIAQRFKVEYFEVADGYAVYKKENPVVMRAVFQGKRKN